MSQQNLKNEIQIGDDELALIAPSPELKEVVIQYKEEHFAYGDMLPDD